MPISISSLVVVLAGVVAAPPQALKDDLSKFPAGTDGKPLWRIVSGDWKVIDGKLRQSAEGDAAVIAEVRPPARFHAAVQFHTLGGLPGEGLLFNVHPGARLNGRPASAQVVRVDPEGIYHGYLDASGEFHGEGPVGALVVSGVSNRLEVDADGPAGIWSISFNGKQVASRLVLEYDQGDIGLVAGGGVSEFESIEVAALEGPGGGAPAGDPRKPIAIASGPTGDLIVLQAAGPLVRVEGKDGKEKASFGKPLEGRRPVAVATGPKGEVYILYREGGAIARFPAEGGPPDGDAAKIPAAAEPRSLSSDPPLDGARAIAVFPDGRLAVSETRASQVAVLGPDGARLLAFGKKANGGPGLERPAGIAVDSKGRVVVADTRDFRLLAYAPDGKGGFVLERLTSRMGRPNSLAVGPGDTVAVLGRFAEYETGGALRFFDRDLYPRGFVAGFAVGDFAEEGGVAVVPGTGEVVYLSRKDGRVFRLPAGLTGAADVQPAIEPKDGNIVVSWTSLADPPAGGARLEHRAAGGNEWTAVPVEAKGRSFRAVIPCAGLDPSAPREFRFLPHYAALPDLGPSMPYRFYPPEPPGKRRYLDLSIAIAAYAKMEEAIPEEKEETKSGKPEKREPKKRARYEVKAEGLEAKVRGEFERAREFYARNSRFRLNIHADIYVIDDPPASPRNGWLDPSQVRRDLQARVTAAGRKLEAYDSLIGCWAEQGLRLDRLDDLGTVGGGGLTSFAYTSFGMGGRLAWLFLHEYHHQIDAFFNRSGHLAYPLNHPDATVEPGRYGQHWDCNAFFLRSWPDQYWFVCTFGRVLLTDDADGDGVPDKDPALALDEVRLGSDPTKKDTDGDGLDDLAEAMAGTFRGTDPRKPDTDGDGLPDGADPRPLHRAAPDLLAGTPTIDGKIQAGEWQDMGEIAEPGLHVGARWDAKNLYIAAWAKRQLLLTIDVDGADDGWFLEADNASVTVNLDGGLKPAINGAQGAAAAGSGGASAPQAEVAIPWSAMHIAERKAGDRFGLLVRASWREGDVERELFLFEPWELFEVTAK